MAAKLPGLPGSLAAAGTALRAAFKKSFTNGVKQSISSALRAVRFTPSWRFAAHIVPKKNTIGSQGSAL
jgi:hypothetical protein